MAVVFGASRPLPFPMMPRWSDLAYAASGLALGGLLLLGAATEDPPDQIVWPVEIGFGAAALLALLLLRRRRPAGLAFGMALVAPLSTMSLSIAALAILNAAIHRPWRRMAPAAVLFAVEVAVLFSLDDELAYWSVVPPILFLEAALVASGMLVRSQRELVRSLREQAKLATEEARRLERERIAREMHDVLGHRISLLALHAGALEFSPHVSRDEMARAVSTIRSCAYDAAEDLREVIGVLRTASDTSPQPTLSDLPALVSEHRVTSDPSGATLVCPEVSLDDVPAAIGRHAYRIVQEGLTNARKHAPGQPVRVTVSGGPGTGLTVGVRNPLGAADPRAVGAGAGLVGVAERVELAGGRLEHGRTGGGEFFLEAWLPWPA
jgi:signal transduction histidine kinase